MIDQIYELFYVDTYAAWTNKNADFNHLNPFAAPLTPTKIHANYFNKKPANSNHL